ncbi:MAG: hypothetical protein KKG59_03790 [Nanoarchaeota archaeon]|nr:hypothetical protein [Nanoarchaeota archaeon]
MRVVERSVQEIGKSLLITLPKEWVNLLGVKKGNKLKILISERGTLQVSPEFIDGDEHTTVTLHYDQHFKRRFLRDYFNGNERIVIKFKRPLSEVERKDLYVFLKRFMNAQIIEETPTKKVVKCFKIDELSIDECLRRMFFLCMNIFDEAVEGRSHAKMQELLDTMRRFYYMLVMQVRRFLSEGKYVKENQIPLIRALDFRMVAEKVERIGHFAQELGMSKHLNIKYVKIARDYFQRSFNCFIKPDYDKATPLWQEAWVIQKQIEKKIDQAHKSGNIDNYQEFSTLLWISRTSKDISMLIR